MNEHIKELVEQSGLHYHNSNTNESNVVDGEFKYPRLEDYKKFADLIIAECAKAVLSTPCPYDERHPLFPQLTHTWDMAVLESHRQILLHFGMRVGERNEQPYQRNR